MSFRRLISLLLRSVAVFLGVFIFASIAEALTIAAYNVENYLVTDRMVEGVYHQAYPKPEKEKAALRQVVSGISPDILAVEEMGTQPFLDEFPSDLKRADQNFPFTALLEGADPD